MSNLKGIHKRSPVQGRIRAFRHENVENQLKRTSALLGMGNEWALDPAKPHRLARALRMARRAASGGMPDYDPLRHLLLARYLKSLRLWGRFADSQSSQEIMQKTPPAREDVYDRSLVSTGPEPYFSSGKNNKRGQSK